MNLDLQYELGPTELSYGIVKLRFKTEKNL